jgi:hypothetical protein
VGGRGQRRRNQKRKKESSEKAHIRL